MMMTVVIVTIVIVNITIVINHHRRYHRRHRHHHHHRHQSSPFPPHPQLIPLFSAKKTKRQREKLPSLETTKTSAQLPSFKARRLYCTVQVSKRQSEIHRAGRPARLVAHDTSGAHRQSICKPTAPQKRDNLTRDQSRKTHETRCGKANVREEVP